MTGISKALEALFGVGLITYGGGGGVPPLAGVSGDPLQRLHFD
jgi:hypothetical protein